MNTRKTVLIPFMIACMVVLNTHIPVWAAESAQMQSASPRHSPSAVYSGSVQEMMVMINKPATPTGLLENIKWGMEHNVFLREDFYTEENIRRVLGDYPLRWEANAPKVKYLTIEPNAQPLPSSEPNHGCIFAAVMSWGIKSGGGAAPLAKFQISIDLKYVDPGCAPLSVDLTQSLFGEPTKVESIFPPDRPPPHGRDWVPGPTIHPFGNNDIEYFLGNTAISKRLKLEVLGNGVIRRFFLFMEEM